MAFCWDSWKEIWIDYSTGIGVETSWGSLTGIWIDSSKWILMAFCLGCKGYYDGAKMGIFDGDFSGLFKGDYNGDLLGLLEGDLDGL
jgi:hypothetical protein